MEIPRTLFPFKFFITVVFRYLLTICSRGSQYDYLLCFVSVF
jgi:hypothetical protein